MEISKEQLNKIFSQPFYYFASGKECYVFSSKDNKYIVKFFKQKHMKTTGFFPKPNRKLLRNKTYTSYQIAYEKFREESKLLYLHLTKTKHLKKTLHLIDNRGKPFSLKLDNMEFLIQRRGETLLSYLQKHPAEKEQIKKKLISFVENRAAKGICDNDNNCERNLGIIDGEVFEIDIGEFSFAKEKDCCTTIENLLKEIEDVKL
ncbi:MAG: hypothetical protein ChlgKO_10250 [Chlamydiales bacterium]